MNRLFRALLLLLALLAAPAAWAATLTASVDRTQVEMGETLTLILSLSGGDSTRPPDLSGLSADFDILDRRRGSRPVTADGKRTMVNDWVLTLLPRRTGTLTIPALSVSGASSEPIRIEASAPAPAPAAKGETKPLFVEVDVAPGAVYAQGEIPVHVRIYDSLGMRSGSISQIRADGASFREDGQQDSYLKTIGKTRYRVVQQTYVMTPQRSGTIEIEPVSLKANIPVPVDTPMPSEMARLLGRGNVPMPWLDGGLTRGQDVTLHSAPVKVEVLPRPAGAQGWFLPARRVAIHDNWSPALAKARVGETLTRTLTVEAVGASPNQLPPLETPDVPGLRQYQEDSRTEAAMIAGEPGAALVKTVSVVPSEAGTFTLPALTVGWWNTATRTQEHAVLPAVTFTVAPAATAPAPPPAAAQAVSAPSAGEQTPQTPLAPPPPSGAGDMAAGFAATAGALAARALGAMRGLLAHGPWIAGAIGAVLLALGLAALLRPRRAPAAPAARASLGGRAVGREAAARDLKAACRANDPHAAHAAYLSWRRATPLKGGHGIKGDHGITRAPQEPPDLAAAVADLQAHLYGAPGTPWRGARLLAAWTAAQKQAARRARPAPGATLAPLYPEG